MSIKRVKLLEHSTGTSPRVWAVTWNHNGKVFASCGEDRSIKIWRLNDLVDKVDTISGDHTRAIRSVTFSPCGRYLAVASFDASIIVYEFKDGEFEEVHKLEGHENEVKSCAYSASGRFLATSSRDKSVWVWQRKYLWRFNMNLVDEEDDFDVCSILQSHTADVKFVLWHPSDDILVSGGYDCSIRFYCFDGDDFVTIQKIDMAHDSTVWAGSFNQDGKYLVTVGDDKFLKIWKQQGSNSLMERSWMKLLEVEVDTRWPLYTVDWNHLTNQICVGSGDGKVRVYQFDLEAESVAKSGSFSLDDEVNCVRWHPSNPQLLSVACDDGFVHLLHVNL